MGTGRIESERRDAALARIAQPTRNALAEINKPSQTTSPPPPQPASHKDFEALLDTAGQRASATIRSPRQWVADFVMPRISDPTLFQGSRSVWILERLASDILPTLDESEELRSLAGVVIADEIERHRALLARLHGGIAS